jgi:cytochrome b involved in lipid metabolism
MNKNLILIFVVMIALAAGLFTYFRLSRSGQSTSLPAANTITQSQPAASGSGAVSENKTYSLEQIALHDRKEDCWFAIEGKVYDVTSYIAGKKHPGDDTIIAGCGKDATELFNTRPMGSGTPHSQKARNFLVNFQIGTLEK